MSTRNNELMNLSRIFRFFRKIIYFVNRLQICMVVLLDHQAIKTICILWKRVTIEKQKSFILNKTLLLRWIIHYNRTEHCCITLLIRIPKEDKIAFFKFRNVLRIYVTKRPENLIAWVITILYLRMKQTNKQSKRNDFRAVYINTWGNINEIGKI